MKKKIAIKTMIIFHKYIKTKQRLLSNRARDGSYLAEFLLYKGYEVHGLIRRASTFNREGIISWA